MSTENKYMLVEVCPHKPSERATDEEIQAYLKSIKADEMARCYILVSMSNVLQIAVKELMNTTMAGGTLVKDRVLKMIGLLDELKILGAEIHGFFLNYNMNKLFYLLIELLKELQAAKGLIRKPTITLVTKKGSTSRPKGRKK
ncbi:uncharacterized protein LOC131162679 [Malania oleifera]|uniref:uncharacterized protein LOC131162679 n=1 Tax=Malania oleifera TaxID=397392 RepID=UPI0025AE0E18|nr:uncharacterized protein LOC131162679 [Malania oleifera]